MGFLLQQLADLLSLTGSDASVEAVYARMEALEKDSEQARDRIFELIAALQNLCDSHSAALSEQQRFTAAVQSELQDAASSLQTESARLNSEISALNEKCAAMELETVRVMQAHTNKVTVNIRQKGDSTGVTGIINYATSERSGVMSVQQARQLEELYEHKDEAMEKAEQALQAIDDVEPWCRPTPLFSRLLDSSEEPEALRMTSSTLGSTDAGCSVVYSTKHACFLLRVGLATGPIMPAADSSVSFYPNWTDASAMLLESRDGLWRAFAGVEYQAMDYPFGRYIFSASGEPTLIPLTRIGTAQNEINQ